MDNNNDMKSNTYQQRQNQETIEAEGVNEIEFSIIEILQTLLTKRKQLLLFGVLGLTVGLFYSFLFNPNEYKSRAVILPVSSSVEPGASGLLKQFGKLGGLNLSGGSSSEGIPAGLYPNVVNSTPFLIYLSEQSVFVEELDSTLSIYNYFDQHQGNTVGSFIKEWTLGFPDKVTSWIRGSEESVVLKSSSDPNSLIRLTKRQSSVINTLNDRIAIQLDEEAGIVELTVTMPEREMSAEVGVMTLEYLMEYSIAFKIDKELDNQAFIKGRYEEAKTRFIEVQNKLAIFNDRNQNLTLASAQAEQQRLESEYNLAFNLYNGLSQQLEESKIKVQEKTPTFKILEPVQIPINKSSPRKLLIILLFGIIGALTGLFWSLYGTYIRNVVKQITIKDDQRR